MANAPTQELLKSLDRKEILIKADIKNPKSEIKINGINSIKAKQDGYLQIIYRPSTINFLDILQQLESQKVSIIDIISKETDLEDIFLEFVRGQKNGD